jgi:hypothetical protein
MLNDKIFGTLIAMVLAILAVIKISFDNKKKIREDYINVPLTIKKQEVAGGSPQNLFAVPSNYQSMLSPRFSNLDYGSNIRYNLPSNKNMAVPTNPLGYSQMVVQGPLSLSNGVPDSELGIIEGFNGCGSCKGGCKSPPDCARGGVGGNMAMEMNALAGMHANPAFAAKKAGLQYQEATSMLPVRAMTDKGSLQALSGNNANPIIYDRYIYANQKSRLRSLGDPIRGDLPIIPNATGWFQPSVRPNIDLHDGALSMIGGAMNQTQNRTNALQSVSVGGVPQLFGGMNYSIGKQSGISPAHDISVTSYP